MYMYVSILLHIHSSHNLTLYSHPIPATLIYSVHSPAPAIHPHSVLNSTAYLTPGSLYTLSRPTIVSFASHTPLPYKCLQSIIHSFLHHATFFLTFTPSYIPFSHHSPVTTDVHDHNIHYTSPLPTVSNPSFMPM